MHEPVETLGGLAVEPAEDGKRTVRISEPLEVVCLSFDGVEASPRRLSGDACGLQAGLSDVNVLLSGSCSPAGAAPVTEPGVTGVAGGCPQGGSQVLVEFGLDGADPVAVGRPRGASGVELGLERSSVTSVLSTGTTSGNCRRAA